MPNRILREGILTSERLDRIADSPEVEVFLRRLHSIADDFGRFSGHPSLIRAAAYPLRLDKVTDAEISEYTRQCAAAGLIRLYCSGGKPYLEIVDFRQQVRAKKSKCPAPEQHMSSGCTANAEQVHSICEQMRSEAEAEARGGDERREARGEGERREAPIYPTRANSAPDVEKLIAQALEPHGRAIGKPVDDKLCQKIIEAANGNGYAAVAFIDKKIRREFGDTAPQNRRRDWPESLGWWVTVIRGELGRQSDDEPRSGDGLRSAAEFFGSVEKKLNAA